MTFAPDFVDSNLLPVNDRPSFTVHDGGRSGHEKAKRVRVNGRPAAGQASASKDTTTSERKPPVPTAAKIFADQMMRQGIWAANNPSEGSASSGSSEVLVYRWNELYWEHMGLIDGVAHAGDWLDTHMIDKASEKNAVGGWKWLALRLRRTAKLPLRSAVVAVIPCQDAYLEVSRSGIRALAPEKTYGLTYATKISCGTPHGANHELLPFDRKSMFGKWITNALPDPDVLAMVQEQCGMFLLPGCYQKAVWWFGKAGSGKSTLGNLVQGCLSSVACIRLASMSDQFGLESVVGAQMIRVEEVEQGEKWDEGIFKPLVSGDPVYVNRKNEKALASYRSFAKVLLTSNPDPFIRDKSDGVMRRLDLVRWDHVLVGQQDPEFAEKLLASEGRHFLDWMLAGAMRVIERGRMMNDRDAEFPEAARRLREEVRCNTDSVRAWVSEEKVHSKAGAWVPTASIYKRYCDWSLENNLDPVDTSVLIRSLSQMVEVKLGKRSNRRISGKGTWCYEMTWSDVVSEDMPAPKAKFEFSACTAEEFIALFGNLSSGLAQSQSSASLNA